MEDMDDNKKAAALVLNDELLQLAVDSEKIKFIVDRLSDMFEPTEPADDWLTEHYNYAAKLVEILLDYTYHADKKIHKIACV